MTATQRTWLGLIMVGYFLLGLVYLWATPPLESSDEYKHYPVVQYIQTQHSLPVLEPENPGLWLQEGAQPPLYYLLMAGLTSWIDTSDLAEVHHKNPYAFIGNPNQVGNKNLIIHDPQREQFPWQGTILAINLIRLASIGLGLGTIWLTFRLGRLLFSPQIGLLAAAFTAFNPMFLFVSAAVNNDSLSILLGHWGLYLLVKLWRERPDPQTEWRRYVGLGLVLGLGILTKLSLGGLLGLTGLALAWPAWRHKQWRLLFGGGLMVVVVATAVSGWWFMRNWQVYGDLTGLNAFIAVQGIRKTPLTLAGWIDEFGTFYRSFWGLFGGVNVAAPQIFYSAANLMAIVAAAGFIYWLWRNRHDWPAGLGLLIAWIGGLLLLLIRWNLISPAFQGRLVFPALGAINVLWAVGLLAWKRPNLAVGAAGLLAVAALLLPWTTIRPAYAYPEPVTAVSPTAQFGPVTFQAKDGAIQLIGVEMEPGQSVTPAGDPVKLVLYWQMVSPVSQDYLSSVHLLGRKLESVGSVNRYPARGMIPTSRWQPGQIWRDEYHVYVHKNAAAPSQLRVSVSLYDDEAERPLPAAWPDSTAVDLLLVGEPARLAASTPPAEAQTRLNIPFAEGITLSGYDLAAGDPVQLTLYWQAKRTPAQDYTVFIQLLNSAGEWLAGADAPPVNNFYPTSLWQKGDWIDDLHVLPLPPDLPSGAYTIRVGLYDPISGARLARQDGGGDAVDIPLEAVGR